MKYRLQLVNCLIGVITVLSLSSCEEYLSEVPTKGSNQPITTVEQLEGILENIVFYTQTDNAMVLSTDNFELPMELYDAQPIVSTLFSMELLYHYTFDIDGIIGWNNDATWSDAYSNIYKANLILENTDKVEGDPGLKARIKAEAYFLRAYSNWILVNTYCLPYCAANLNEQGLPGKMTTDMDEKVHLMTLEETYQFIENDLTEALKVDREVSENNWRISKAAVNAFLSRFYLVKGDYVQAINTASYALENKGISSLKDYNALGSIPYIGGVLFPETSMYDDKQVVEWQEFYYARATFLRSQMFIPSSDLLVMYDKENDMRYRKFFREGGVLFGFTTPDVLVYDFFVVGALIPSGPTVSEVMLNKAESLLRKNNPDIAGALRLINELREKRMAPETPDIHITADTKEEALKKVLEERRRELPFASRWVDIRRFAVNETPEDDVSVSHTFYALKEGVVDKTEKKTYVLPVGSRRYAVPVNGIEIESARGQLKQNTY